MNTGSQSTPILARCALVLLPLLMYAPFSSGQVRPPYSESAKNLRLVIEELQQAAKQNDQEHFRRAAEPLFFAGHEPWFREVFGERFGTHASNTYAKRTADFFHTIRAAFERLEVDGLRKPQVEKLDEPCEPQVLTIEYPILFARKKKIPFYSVRFEKDRKFTTLGFFVYKDGGFRYIGHVDLGPVFGPPMEERRASRVRIGGNVQAAKLIHKPQPHYPDNARRLGIQGTVRLHALIGTDGSIQQLQLMSGQCHLAAAAIEAVSKWRYTPTMLEGVAVEVFSTIDVIFTLSR